MTTEIRIYGPGNLALFRDGRHSGTSVYMRPGVTPEETRARAEEMAREYASPTTREVPAVVVMAKSALWGE